MDRANVPGVRSTELANTLVRATTTASAHPTFFVGAFPTDELRATTAKTATTATTTTTATTATTTTMMMGEAIAGVDAADYVALMRRRAAKKQAVAAATTTTTTTATATTATTATTTTDMTSAEAAAAAEATRAAAAAAATVSLQQLRTSKVDVYARRSNVVRSLMADALTSLGVCVSNDWAAATASLLNAPLTR
jgi:hypothetical protein